MTYGYASWAYHWVLEYLIDNVADQDVVVILREIDENNLKWIGIDRFPREQQDEIVTLLANELVLDARERLPATMPDRESANERLAELADRARKYVH